MNRITSLREKYRTHSEAIHHGIACVLSAAYVIALFAIKRGDVAFWILAISLGLMLVLEIDPQKARAWLSEAGNIWLIMFMVLLLVLIGGSILRSPPLFMGGIVIGGTLGFPELGRTFAQRSKQPREPDVAFPEPGQKRPLWTPPEIGVVAIILIATLVIARFYSQTLGIALMVVLLVILVWRQREKSQQ